MFLTLILSIFALLSVVLTLWQWFVAFRFPLHRRMSRNCSVPQKDYSDSGAAESSPHPGFVLRNGARRTGEGGTVASLEKSCELFAPPIALLKPLKSLDVKSAECLESWLAQKYSGQVEILFGVAEVNDPICDLVRELMASHPKAGAQLVICAENLGPNAKVSTLIQLMRLARHDLIVVSDADVWAPEDFLSEVVMPFTNQEVGLVNCFYRMASSAGLAMRWEAFAVNADFWSQVLQAQSLKPLDFALGAVMATTRQQLASIGGFDALADYLADDYQLGHRIADNRARLVLCPVVVECRNAPMSWSEVWTHQLRWARTIRACQPLPYFFSQLHNPTVWPWLWAVWQPEAGVLAFAGACLIIRMATGLYCERKLTGRSDVSSLWLAPVKDLLQTVIWVLAFFGRQITWRGQRFIVQTGGKLRKQGRPARANSG